MATPVERADFDDLVTLVSQAPPWEKDRAAGVRIMLRAIADGKVETVPEQIRARWTWRLARAVRKALDRKASQENLEAKRLLGALANSRGHRHEENAARLVRSALEMPREAAVALLASAEAYTPKSTQLLEAAREQLGTIEEIAAALADDLPAPKSGPSRNRRRRRRKKKGPDGVEVTADGGDDSADGDSDDDGSEAEGETASGGTESTPRPVSAAKKRRRRRKPAGAKPAGESSAASGTDGAVSDTSIPPEPSASAAAPAAPSVPAE